MKTSRARWPLFALAVLLAVGRAECGEPIPIEPVAGCWSRGVHDAKRLQPAARLMTGGGSCLVLVSLCPGGSRGGRVQIDAVASIQSGA